MAKSRVRGADRLTRKLRDMPDQVHEGAEAGVDDSAHALKSGEQQRAPVDTGRLRDSVQVEPTSGATGRPGRRVGPGDYVHYAPFVENGTSRMAAQPFVRPSVEVERRQTPDRVATQVRDRLPTKRGGGR